MFPEERSRSIRKARSNYTRRKEVLTLMIKKSIAYIEKFCRDIEIDPFEADPIKGAYEEGSKDVAGNVLEGLRGLEKLYSVYESNPFAKGADKWEEFACTPDPDSAQQIAEAMVRLHSGQINIRYEGADNKVYSVKLEGKYAHHREITEGKR
jgi:hypothetical protein